MDEDIKNIPTLAKEYGQLMFEGNLEAAATKYEELLSACDSLKESTLEYVWDLHVIEIRDIDNSDCSSVKFYQNAYAQADKTHAERNSLIINALGTKS